MESEIDTLRETNDDTEPVRVERARVVRDRVDATVGVLDDKAFIKTMKNIFLFILFVTLPIILLMNPIRRDAMLNTSYPIQNSNIQNQQMRGKMESIKQRGVDLLNQKTNDYKRRITCQNANSPFIEVNCDPNKEIIKSFDKVNPEVNKYHFPREDWRYSEERDNRFDHQIERTKDFARNKKEDAKQVYGEVKDFLQEKKKKAMEFYNENLKEFVDEKKEKVKEFYDENLKEFVDDNKEKVKEFYDENLKEFVEDNKEKAKDFVDDKKDRVKEYYGNAKDFLRDKKEEVKEFYDENLKEFIDEKKEKVKEFYDENLKEFVEDAKEKVKDFDEKKERAKEKVENFFGEEREGKTMYQATKDFVKYESGKIKDYKESLRDKAKHFYEDTKDFIKEKSEKMKDFLDEKKDRSYNDKQYDIPKDKDMEEYDPKYINKRNQSQQKEHSDEGKLEINRFEMNMNDVEQPEEVSRSHKDTIPLREDEKIVPTLGSKKISEIKTEQGNEMEHKNYEKDKGYVNKINAKIIYKQPFTSPTYARFSFKSYLVNVFSFALGGKELLNYPVNALSDNMEPGHCYSFKGKSGNLTIDLKNPVNVRAVSLEHPNTGHLESSPKRFSVYAYNAQTMDQLYRYPNSIVEIGRDFNFPKGNIGPKIFDTIPREARFLQFRFHENYGDNEYTCVYRINVFVDN